MTIRNIVAAALVAATYSASPAAAAPFTLFIYETPEQLALRTERSPAGQAYWDGYAGIGKDMAQAGILRGGSALKTGDAPIQLGAGLNAATPKTGLALGGYFLIDVADLAQARAWAEKIPAAKTGIIEIAPAFPVPGMN